MGTACACRNPGHPGPADWSRQTGVGHPLADIAAWGHPGGGALSQTARSYLPGSLIISQRVISTGSAITASAFPRKSFR